MAAYRRQARIVHPDVSGTGNTEAFLRLQEAYEVLSDASRRAAYDRAANPPPRVVPDAEPPVPGPRPGDLAPLLWIALGCLLSVATVMAALQWGRPPTHKPPARAAVMPVQKPTSVEAARMAVPAAGASTHYVLPGAGTAVLWRRDPLRDGYLPGGELSAFTPVQALRLVPQHGLMEIRLSDGGSGFVDAARLAPGDAAAAHRAFCADDAGPLPANGDVLDRRGSGPARLTIENRGRQPTVVKLRDTAGLAAMTVYVAPISSVVVSGLPDGRYRAAFAVGELWSRGCRSFAIGMRAQLLHGDVVPGEQTLLVLPPAQAEDISDAEFERE